MILIISLIHEAKIGAFLWGVGCSKLKKMGKFG